MSQRSPVLRENEELARRVNAEARNDPMSPYAGKLVGIANGQIVVVADNWREVATRLREIEPDPLKCYCIDASADYDAVHEIWGLDQRNAVPIEAI